MATSRKKMLRLLEESLENRTPVLVLRREVDAYRTEGIVIGLTSTWVVVLDLVDGVYPDGVVMLRLDLLRKVERSHKSDYIERAHADLGVAPVPFGCQRDDTTRELLQAVEARGGLMNVHLELWNDGAMYLGKIRRVGQKRLDLQFINPNGVWDDWSDRWRLDRITRIECGGRYVEALEQWGDPVPAPPKTRVKR
ncbi:hypothetical protein [Aeromicrobium alkaliterrae]|uniref:Uncharacterized protein n=1 Tax=Aeromicrobium alkaliterrae TaxID=302168 RepID=A0ABN2JGH0_9ACTN